MGERGVHRVLRGNEAVGVDGLTNSLERDLGCQRMPVVDDRHGPAQAVDLPQPTAPLQPIPAAARAAIKRLCAWVG